MNKKKIAIIGSGISGLSASFFLSKDYDVHLFEKNSILGGHTRTIDFKDNNKYLSIDTGFIVFNNETYPDLVSFLNFLDVKVEDSNMSFGVSCEKPYLEYGGSTLNSLFAQRKNFLSLGFYSLLLEIRKFYKICKKLNDSYIDDKISINDFLIKNNFTKQIADFHIYPLISSIWSSNIEDVKNFSFKSFLNFFNNHGLFNLTKRPQWKFISGGSYSYVKALIDKKIFNYYLNFKINNIIRENNEITIIDENKNKQIFDKLIFATHANQITDLLDKPSEDEVKVFSHFKYTKNKAYLHTDEACMPKTKRAWSSWNFLQNSEKRKFSLTYWMNNLQNIDKKNNYFVSINPNIVPNNIIDSTVYEHPIFNNETLGIQKKLGEIQGIQNTFYCGSYCGYGFHEDGIQSAAYIVKKLGVNLPWQRNNNFISRLSY